MHEQEKNGWSGEELITILREKQIRVSMGINTWWSVVGQAGRGRVVGGQGGGRL